MKKINFGIFSFWILSTVSAFAHEGHKETPFQISDIEWGLKGITNLSNIHPLIVHFPIALFMVAALFYVFGTLFKKEGFLSSGKWTLWLGTLGAGAAVWAGLQAANVVNHDEVSHRIMTAHEYLGYVVLGLGVLLSLWLVFAKTHLPRPKVLFLAGIILLNLILVQQADMGGQLVYAKGVGVAQSNAEEKGAIENSEETITPVLIWKNIKEAEQKLEDTIEAGKLSEVHEIAFSIRDQVKLLLAQLINKPGVSSESLTKETDQIGELAENLDKYGDANDKGKTEEQFKMLKTLLSMIEKQWA